MLFRSSPLPLRPLLEATGGGSQVFATDGMPALRRVSAKSDRSGFHWFGLKRNEDYVVTGIDQAPLLPPWAALFLGLGAIMLAWKREGR